MRAMTWWLLAGLAGAGAAWYASQRWAIAQSAPNTSGLDTSGWGIGSATQSISEDLSVVGETLGITSWKNVAEGSTWVPVLNATEQNYGLPADLLARVAYQESHFRESIIRGIQASPAGALGIMQLEPVYFSTVRVRPPFSDADVRAQIDQAAQQLQSLYGQFGDWSLALAAYNAGAGNVRKYGGIPPFTETQNYVAQISADVPSLAGSQA